MITTLICIVIVLLWLVLSAWYEWPRYVYPVRQYISSRQDIHIVVFTSRKKADKHVYTQILNHINTMNQTDLLILCHELGFRGLGKQPTELIREMIIEEIKIPAKYAWIKSLLHIYTPECTKLS